ncbi:MAG: hypothetical protein HYV97_07650 [Bdellovibrio sp.]|nr:hypothetical protein [Bdellovibrio sp.]
MLRNATIYIQDVGLRTRRLGRILGLIIAGCFALFLSSTSMAQQKPTTLQNFIVNYFVESREAFSLIGLPAPNHCELNPTTDKTRIEPPPYILHLPSQGPHLWTSCSFEELTFDCHIFHNANPAILYLPPSSVIGALPTGVLAPFFSRSTNGNAQTLSNHISRDMEAGLSLDQIMMRLDSRNQTATPAPLPRLQVLSKLFFDEQKKILGTEQSRKEVRILSQDPRCALNPFFIGVESENNLLMVCPALSVLPNVLVASLFAQTIFKEASPEQQQQALVQLGPLPPNFDASKAYQKWRLIQNLNSLGIRQLNAPELRLLTTYPEALYACAYQQQPSNQAAFLQMKNQINALSSLPFAHKALLCPANIGANEKP